MHVIVHIGMEKTGTSSIQSYLYENRKRLASHGYHFLQSAGEQNNWLLPFYCSADTRMDDMLRITSKHNAEADKAEVKAQFLQDFEKELAGLSKKTHTVIVSSEHFHSRIQTDEEMQAVHAFFAAYFDSVSIICYIREQAATCASWYSTHLKSAGTRSFQDFMLRCNPRRYYFNYHDMLDNWERHFGISAMTVAVFSRDSLLNGDLLDDFTARIDASLVGKLSKKIKVENESLNPAGQALARAINIILPLDSELENAAQLSEQCKAIVMKKLSGSGQQADLASRQAIFDDFSECNEQVREKYFPNLDQLFAPPAESTPPPTGIDEKFYQALAELSAVIAKQPRNAIIDKLYVDAWQAISMCVDDVVKATVVQIERRDLDESGKIVHLLYQSILARDATPTELERRTERLASGGLRTSELVQRIVESPEWERKKPLLTPNLTKHRAFPDPEIFAPIERINALFECTSKFEQAKDMRLDQMYRAIIAPNERSRALTDDDVRRFVNTGKAYANRVAALYGRLADRPADDMECLEFGAGVGHRAISMASLTAKVHAVDFKQSHLEELEKNAGVFGCADKITTHSLQAPADIAQLPTVDFIYSFISLQHHTPPVSAFILLSLLEHLRPGGFAFLHVPLAKPAYEFTTKNYLADEKSGTTIETHILPRANINTLAERAQCDIVMSHCIGGGKLAYSEEIIFHRPPRRLPT